MKLENTYEWCFEEWQDSEHKDIIENWFSDKLEDLRVFIEGRYLGEVCLRLTQGNEADGVQNIYYAYPDFKAGTIPQNFSDGQYEIAIKVPKRFLTEFQKFINHGK